MQNDDLREVFHTLSQPIAGLQLTLEIAKSKESSDPEYLREVISDALLLTNRLSDALKLIRDPNSSL